MILAGIGCAIYMFLPMPAALFGMVLDGWSAHLFYLATAIAYIWIGVGLLRLWSISRKAAIGVFAFGLVNAAVFVLWPGFDARITAATARFSNLLPVNTTFSSAPFTVLALVFTALIMAVVIWFLVRNRSAFEPPCVIEHPS